MACGGDEPLCLWLPGRNGGRIRVSIRITEAIKQSLKEHGVECFWGAETNLSASMTFEPPCSAKWMQTQGEVYIGAFSYAVSGFYADVKIGRYTSIGECVQIGRANHSLDWMSTSPAFYLQEPMFDVGQGFDQSEKFSAFRPAPPPPGILPDKHKAHCHRE